MYNEDLNRTFICPTCKQDIIVSIGQLEWCENISCKHCNERFSVKMLAENNAHKYNDLMK